MPRVKNSRGPWQSWEPRADEAPSHLLPCDDAHMPAPRHRGEAMSRRCRDAFQVALTGRELGPTWRTGGRLAPEPHHPVAGGERPEGNETPS